MDKAHKSSRRLSPMCQHCGRNPSSGIFRLRYREKPEVQRAMLLCAVCGMSEFPSRHTILSIELVHQLGELSYPEGPECTSDLTPTSDACRVGDRIFLTCRCEKCGYSVQFNILEIPKRRFSHTHPNLKHPDYFNDKSTPAPSAAD